MHPYVAPVRVGTMVVQQRPSNGMADVYRRYDAALASCRAAPSVSASGPTREEGEPRDACKEALEELRTEIESLNAYHAIRESRMMCLLLEDPCEESYI